MPIVKLANTITFECSSDQTLLEAARLQGIALEHSCRTGRCGVCKARVLSGTTLTKKAEESLNADDHSGGFILTCCRTAVSDVELDIADLGELGNIETRTLPCRIASIQRLSSNVVEIVLRTPPFSNFKYLPGQYIDVIGKNGLRRSYSIGNAPRSDGLLSLQIREVVDGEMSRYWFNEAKVNDLLRLEGPLGTFCLRESQASQLVLLATGTGIAPIKAILEQLVAIPRKNIYRRIHLYWGGRDESDHYWVPDYPELELRYVPVISRDMGFVGAKGYVQDALVSDCLDLTDAVVYACGSESMIESAKAKLLANGLDQKSFHFDAFVSSN